MRKQVQIEPTERRMCTVLFADIVRSTMMIGSLDPEDAVSHLGPAIELIMSICEKFGATTLFTGDGALAVFGSPNADEDHAVKAIASAQRIIDRIGKLDDRQLDVRVGVHSGELLVGQLQHTLGEEQAFLGPVMNIASKIEAAARKNVVTVSGQVLENAGDLFDHTHVGDLELDGGAGPIQLFEITGRKEQVSRWMARARRERSPFVGRERELAELVAAWNQARDGKGNSVLLLGAAGVGKSRLLHELVENWPLGTHQVLEFNCFSLDQEAAYLPITRVINARLGLADTKSDAELDQKLSEGLGGTKFLDVHTRSALYSLFSRFQTEPALSAVDPSRRRRQLNQMLSRLVLSMKQDKPLLLLFEDLHWADQGTLDVIDNLLGQVRGTNVLILLTSRNANLFTNDPMGLLKVVPVAPLGEAACKDLITRLLGQSDIDGQLGSYIEAMSGRTPLFVEEFAHHMRDRMSQAGFKDGAMDSLGDIEIPARVQPLIASRIDALQSEDRKALQLVAVGGLQWTWGVLADTLQRLGFDAKTQISTLVERGFLELPESQDGQQLRFSHALVQKVGYRSIPRQRRARLHRAIHETLLSRGTSDDLDVAQSIARHADKGELWLEAAEAYTRCGEMSIKLFSFEAAVSYFENALRCIDQVQKRTGTQVAVDLGLRARRGLRVSLVASGNFNRILTISREAEALSDALGDTSARVAFQVDQAIMLTILADVRQAMEVSERALRTATDAEDPRLQANAAFALAQAAWFHGNFAAARAAIDQHADLFQTVFRVAEAGTTGSISVLGLATRANANSMMHRFDEADTGIREVLSIAEETGKAYDLSFALIARGIWCWQRNEPADAAIALRRALRVSDDAGIDVLCCFAAAPLARVQSVLGELPDARLVLNRGLELARDMEMEAFVAWLLSAEVQVLVQEGRTKEAKELQSDLNDLCDRNGYFQHEQSKALRAFKI
ncbi:ATP-binding protein [Ruegeria arenilitoris]|uniref:ATP-binding protein n=1 Tax=Ruegeria arenilitoris TaxID=1173585 RepID=UPI00147AE2BC|nr:adenylate/guanylate cyclase domain-containing protein [Ruegeria arenilitoris]